MSFDAFSLKLLVLESLRDIEGRTVDRIFENRDGEFAFLLRRDMSVTTLYVSVNPNFPVFFHSAAPLPDLSSTPTGFSLLLKKHLDGARLTGVRMLHSDRILALEFRRKDSFSEKTVSVVFEFMGKHGNAFVYAGELDTDALDEGLVAGSWIASDNLCEYISRPQKPDIALAEESGLAVPPEGPKALVKAFTGFSPKLCEFISSTGDVADIAEAFRSENHEEFDATAKNGRGNIFKYYNIGIYIEKRGDNERRFVYPLGRGPEHGGAGPEKAFATLNEAYLEYFILHDFAHAVAGATRKLARLREMAKKRVDTFATEIAASQAHADHARFGELLISAMSEQGFDRNARLADSMEVRGEAVPLDGRYSISDNAQKHFKLAKRLRAKHERAFAERAKLNDILDEIGVCESIIRFGGHDKFPEALRLTGVIAEQLITDRRALKVFLAEFSRGVTELAAKRGGGGRGKKQRASEASADPGAPIESSKYYRHFRSEGGYDIYVGRSDAGNDYVLSKIAGQEDHWFHVKDFRGSSVILKTPKNADPEELEEAISEAALYATHYSGGRNATRIFVSCAKRKHVKKVKRVPGKVTYTNERTILIDIGALERKFGRAEEDDE